MLIASLSHQSGPRGADRVYARAMPRGAVIAVADGAGGTGNGAAAAELAIARVSAGDIATLSSSDACARLLLELDADILLAADGGQTTLALACIVEGVIHGAAVGDSVVWLVHDEGVIDLTANVRPKPLLGSGEAIPTPVVPARVGAGTVLCASDGLWKYSPRQTLTDAVRDLALPGPIDQLVEIVRLRSGELQDDVAAVVARRSAR